MDKKGLGAEKYMLLRKLRFSTRKKDSLVLRFRDNGVPFDPLEYTDDSGQEITGLSIARKLTPDITYNRVLGFNVTVVTVISANPSIGE